MWMLPSIALLTLFSFGNSAVLSGSKGQLSLNHYKLKIEVLRDVLAAECPVYLKYQPERRVVDHEDFQTQLLGDKIVYVKMIKDLLNCRKEKLETTTSTTAATETKPSTTATRTTQTTAPTTTPTTAPITTPTTAPTTTPTTTPTTALPTTPTIPPTTTSSAKPPQPAECLSATNFTQSWRLDHSGNNFKPGGPHSYKGYSCDFHQDIQWFRFTGAAGNKILNTCPKLYSCGTGFPNWTDEEMPKVVGVKSTINTYSYLNEQSKDCKSYSRKVEVMRCSTDTDYDLIYRLVKQFTGTCWGGFCGML